MLRETLTAEVISKMDDVEQLRRFAKFKYDPTGKKYNCDVTISSALSIIHQKDEEDYVPIYESTEEQGERIPHYYINANGELESTLNTY